MYVLCYCVYPHITATVIISEHRPIKEVGHPGIEPGTLRFQDNHETHYATIKVKGKVFYDQEPSVENLLPQFVGKLRYYQLLAVTLLTYPNWQVPVNYSRPQPATAKVEMNNIRLYPCS